MIGNGVGPELEEPARVIIGVVGDTHEGGLAQEPGADDDCARFAGDRRLDGVCMRGSCRCAGWCARAAIRQAIAAMTEQLRLASGGFAVTQVRTMDEMVSTRRRGRAST